MPNMVYLSRIYTRTGDQGQTGLGDGTRVAKDHPRVVAYGSVDELNAMIGVLRLQPECNAHDSFLLQIQNDLFDVGADLCLPKAHNEAWGEHLRVRPEQAQHLEGEIDRLNERLSPLKSFVLPGGQPAAAWCHVARTVCRRAERDTVKLAAREPINTEVVVYLNRLSDFLFVLARSLNDDGRSDILWVPGGKQASPPAK
jgi:cob(I)alamin adenosyltransferase